MNGRWVPTTRKHGVACAAIVIYSMTFLASSLLLCFCPSFFAVMAGCTCVAIICGSRFQPLLSVGLLLMAIICFVFEYRAQQRILELAHRSILIQQQRSETNTPGPGSSRPP